MNPLEYWRASVEHTAQRYYVSFCLLMSSVQDWLIGVRERESGNLNWSSTCSYYSMVHSARLVSFLAFGDFPRRHEDLASLLMGKTSQATFNWTRGFVKLAEYSYRADNDIRLSLGTCEQARSIMKERLSDMGVSCSVGTLDASGYVLDSGRRLRNDSNYESLLIAHEVAHPFMSPTFEQLSVAFEQAAETLGAFSRDVFVGFLLSDPDIEQDRAAYRAFVARYLRDRLEAGIAPKLGAENKLLVRLRGVVEELDQRITAVAPHFHLEEYVSQQYFGPKSRLMREFNEGIADLLTARAMLEESLGDAQHIWSE